MSWFSRRKEKEPWETEDKAPKGDIETAHRIRDICNAAAASADNLAAFANRAGEKSKRSDAERYETAKKRALELAKELSDELLRDIAVRQIVNLCMRANDVETATVLIAAIQNNKVREEMLNEHPSLR